MPGQSVGIGKTMIFLSCNFCGNKKTANREATFKCKVCGEMNFYNQRGRANPVSDRKVEIHSLEGLWSRIIKARAGNVSEHSKEKGNLESHHLRGKENFTLRFSLLGGYCCTYDEHRHGFHDELDPARITSMEDVVRQQRGVDIFERLEALRHIKSRNVDLGEVRLNLEKAAALYGI